MLIYFLIFLFIAFFGAVYRYQLTEKSRWLYFFIMLLLMVLAAFRDKGVDNDMGSYINAITQGWGVAEPSFFVISYVCYDILGSTRLVFIIYAVLSIVLRFTAYKRMSPYLFLTLAIYFATNFVTHEMNQIRASVGFGFMLWAVHYWLNPSGRKHLVSIALMICATLFHYSFVIPFLIMFFIKDNSKNLTYYLLLIPFAYFCHFVGLAPLDILSKVGGSYIASKIQFYQEFGTDTVTVVNIFSALVMIKLFLITMFFILRNVISEKIPYFYYYMKMYVLGLFTLLFFSTIPGAAFRISDILWFVEPLLLPGLFVAFKPRWLIGIILVSICLYWVWLNYVSSDFIRPYSLNFSL